MRLKPRQGILPRRPNCSQPSTQAPFCSNIQGLRAYMYVSPCYSTHSLSFVVFIKTDLSVSVRLSFNLKCCLHVNYKSAHRICFWTQQCNFASVDSAARRVGVFTKVMEFRTCTQFTYLRVSYVSLAHVPSETSFSPRFSPVALYILASAWTLPIKHSLFFWSHDISVTVATVLWVSRLRNLGSIPGQNERLFFSRKPPTGCGIEGA